MSPALEINNLHKRYGKGKDETQALRGVDLIVSEGDRFALLGPNGAGKTTLISIVATLLTPTAGSVQVLGQDVMKSATEVRESIGFVPQDIALYPMLPAIENLRFFGAMQNLSGATLRERISDVLSIVGLTDQAPKKVETFSGGMKRRLNLAVGLLHRPRVLLLDEPTVGVDPQSRNHILESIRRLNQEHGITVIYTTHYMEEVEVLCEHVAIIDHGQIIANDTVHGLTDSLSGSVVSVKCASRDSLVAGLRLAEGISDIVEAESGALSFTSVSSATGLATLVQVASNRGIELDDISVGKTSLEQVFLRLTGRALRD